MGRKDAEVIDLGKYRRQQQRELEGKGLKRKLLRGGALLVLGGISASFLFLAGYGTYRLLSSEPAPRDVQHDPGRTYQPSPMEIDFLPAEEMSVEYLSDTGSGEGVRVTRLGYTISYFDTNKDHTVDQIIIDDTRSSSSLLEKKITQIPVGSSNFIYGTELLREEREKYFNQVRRKSQR